MGTQRPEEKYPMCEKLASVKAESQSIGRFLDWLLHERGEPLVLCEARVRIDSIRHGPLHASVGLTIEKLLAEYFEIDENKLEEERRAMLKELQEKA